ncbi:MAG: glycosyltransferase, partial [Melioribacteraceae bacterium]
MPLISVVTAFYNTELYLKEAIESILNQDFEDFELILIDDGSTDNSLQIANSFKDTRIKIFHKSNEGLSKTLNKGIEIAESNLIMRLDADDIALTNRMKNQYDFLNTNLDFVAIGSNAIIIDKDGNELYTTEQNLSWESIKNNLPINPFYHSSVMMRKDIVIKCGGYPVSIRHHFEDIVLWNKLAKYGKLANLPEALIKYRLVPSALTNRDP